MILKTTIGALAAATMFLAGCTGTATVRTNADLVYEPPPPPRATVVVQDRPDAVWVAGHWAWNGYDWEWQEGYWQPRRYGYVWVQPRWETRGRGYVYVPGRWSTRGSVHVRPYRGRQPVYRGAQPRGHHRRPVEVR